MWPGFCAILGPDRALHRRLIRAAGIFLLLSACAPLPAVQVPASTSTARQAAPTPASTASPSPAPEIPPTPPAVQPQGDKMVRYGEPAGCRVPLPGETFEDRLAYAEQIYGFAGSLQARWQRSAWNPISGRQEDTGAQVVSLRVEDLQPESRLQELANALFVAGFIPWLRLDEENKLHLLGVALRDGVMDSIWASYVSAYFAGPLSEPDNDLSVIPIMRLSPCDWMVAQGYAPAGAAGGLEMAGWVQPDFAAAAQPFLASTTEDTYQVAYRIDWQVADESESPTTMCGPLTWAILAQAGALPPGYGAWRKGAISFWLPDPQENGRPWNLFPEWMYTVERSAASIQSYDFAAHPLYPGDMVYTYAQAHGFEHVLVVSEVDKAGRAYAVTNLIRAEYTIQRVLLYDPADPSAGIYRNEWETDTKYGRTGQGGFEIFRWRWREKDILGQPAAYTILPGDTLPLVAAKWRTPPEVIAAANGLDPAQALVSGSEITIPPAS